ncbi:PKD domain-containing protein [Simiduia aestuariiviva]|uniref:PKD repeat protein n=1 Tax=Simiduia aestuariiviva TaxID=1510459 RepID=A0A839UQS5_9GAMM|nr:PKD domain-containing protein [Simiduia aestuariiviva]MBB3167898.1 PKD repeat protein [Simiduia aestuariiviva]
MNISTSNGRTRLHQVFSSFRHLIFATLLCSPVVQGAVVVTEIMQNPNAVSDASGEWFEVFNTGSADVNLNGWTLRDNGSDSHVVNRDVVIAAGTYAILGRNGDATTNGGIGVDYQYSGITLANSADEIILVQPDGTVEDSVYYGLSGWPNPTGASMELMSASLDNNVAGNWSTATNVMASGDKGTPGSGPDGGPVGNRAPSVNAGFDKTLTLTGPSVSATLAGSASDPDGDPLTVQWVLAAGNAASVTLHTPSQANTDVTFTALGQFTFELSADDGQLVTTDTVTVNVVEYTPPPPAGSYNVYFGNTHAHSEYSDGNKANDPAFMDAASGFRYARDTGGLDWLILSEHNHSMAGMQLANFHAGKAEAASVDAESASFTPFLGTEWGTITTNGNPDGHVITVTDGLLGWEPGNYDVFIARSDYDALFNYVASVGSFVELAHPGSGDYSNLFNIPYNAVWDQAISLSAVKSGPAFAQETDYSNPSASSYQSRYFDLLLKGYHVGPTADQDTHYHNWGLANEQRTAVLATENSRAAILEALKAGRTYAVEDRNILVDFSANYTGQTFALADTVQMDVGTTVGFTVTVSDPDAGDSISQIELLSGAIDGSSVSTVTSVASDTLTWSVTPTAPTQVFYLARITQADGQKAWTAPIWLNPTGAPTGNTPPVANFSHTTSTLTASFVDSSSDSDGSVVSWTWDFGDGNVSSAQHPSHTYAAAGSYSVTLTVTDDAGATASSTGNVSVAVQQPPNASFTTAVNALTVSFTDASTDADGSVVAWLWDFGDGATDTQQHPTHSYGSVASYTVALTVTDTDGLTDTTTASVSTAAAAGCTNAAGTWDGVSFTCEEVDAVLDMTNNATFNQLSSGAGLRNSDTNRIINNRPIASMDHLSGLSKISGSDLTKLRDYVPTWLSR